MERVDLLLKGCLILTVDPSDTVIEHGFVAIDGGKIVGVGRAEECEFRGEETIDARGKLAMPGLVNAHTHSPMTLLRGVVEDLPLDKWLNEAVWPVEAKLKASDVYWGAMLGCLEMAKFGVTCFNDQYFFMDQVAKAVEQVGIRGVLAHGVIGAGKPDGGESDLKTGLSFALKYNGYAGGRVVARLGPHAEYTCSLELLAKARELATKHGLGIHFHFAESKQLYEKVRSEWGKSPTFALDEIGFWGKDVIIAHAIYLERSEMEFLAKRGVSAAYNPVSNMKLASGAARVEEMVASGMTVALGTDGPASNNTLDMLKDMKFAAYLQKHSYCDTTALPAKRLIRMATIEGAKALNLDDKVGSIEVGKEADLILIDLKRPHLTPLHDPFALVAYSALGPDVTEVVVKGRLVVRGGKAVFVDEEEVMRRASNAAYDLLERAGRVPSQAQKARRK